MISAKVMEDSISPAGDRLTTMQVECHRFVLAEFNTHRVFSRNSASSRAIPVEKQLERVRYDPAYPIEWPCEQSGMQGGALLEGMDLAAAKYLWDTTRIRTLDAVDTYLKEHPDKSERLHKSLLNRLLEPYFWHTICVTATEWDGWNLQRCSPLAQPEIRVLAEKMREAMEASTPQELTPGQYHLPYVTEEDLDECDERDIDPRAISAARCARTSYLTQEGTRDLAKDVELFDRLSTASPPHASPLEHVATPANPGTIPPGNFRGWHQLRHEFFS